VSETGPKKRDLPGHSDDWLMTYADTITLLLCLFVVYFIVSTARKEVSQTAPLVLARPTAEAVALFSPLPQIPADSVARPEPAPIDPPRSAVEATNAALEETPPPILAILPAASVAPETDDASDRITIIDMGSAAFFASGSATLSDAGKSILLAVTADLQSAEHAGYQITVEGHTDDVPIRTALFPSNWELSTARASAVVHFFLDQGIPAQRLRAAGYADTFPKAPNRDAEGAALPDNQAQNRRVVIKLEKLRREDR